MITHIGGLDSVIETTAQLPNLPGGKKLIYTNIALALTAIEEFAEKGTSDPLFATLADITAEHHASLVAGSRAISLDKRQKATTRRA